VVTAITGGIAEGKSTLLGCLSELGYRTASADDIARDVFNDPGVNRLIATTAALAFPVNPSDLRQAFADRPHVRRLVNGVMHPRVLKGLKESTAEFVEIPLLIETCLQSEFDQIWVVTCGREEQLRRLRKRYGDSFDFHALLAAQLPTSAKTPFADEVFRTNQPIESVRRNVSDSLARRFESG
jgi:dephospho-CoA kinase